MFGLVEESPCKSVWTCANGFGDALRDEAEQFGFDVVACELDRKFLGALTVARLRKDLVNSVPDVPRNGLVGSQVDAVPDHWTWAETSSLSSVRPAEMTGMPWEIAMLTVP
jgi:hypothetical protein